MIIKKVDRFDGPTEIVIVIILMLIGLGIESEILIILSLVLFFYCGALMFFRPGKMETKTDMISGMIIMILSACWIIVAVTS